mmetsp:Transcript_46127/g.90913  ORF Transcript_46127/g.90913 Transcript_46127/m.90913 type:complete len:277 (-) Transcript_46127:1075-1905(-)
MSSLAVSSRDLWSPARRSSSCPPTLPPSPASERSSLSRCTTRESTRLTPVTTSDSTSRVSTRTTCPVSETSWCTRPMTPSSPASPSRPRSRPSISPTRSRSGTPPSDSSVAVALPARCLRSSGRWARRPEERRWRLLTPSSPLRLPSANSSPSTLWWSTLSRTARASPELRSSTPTLPLCSARSPLSSTSKVLVRGRGREGGEGELGSVGGCSLQSFQWPGPKSSLLPPPRVLPLFSAGNEGSGGKVKDSGRRSACRFCAFMRTERRRLMMRRKRK